MVCASLPLFMEFISSSTAELEVIFLIIRNSDDKPSGLPEGDLSYVPNVSAAQSWALKKSLPAFDSSRRVGARVSFNP